MDKINDDDIINKTNEIKEKIKKENGIITDLIDISINYFLYR